VTAWFGLVLWGGLVGLDSTSFPQAMISRPVVAGAVTGLIFGRPVEGAVFGFLVEVFALITLPIGAAKTPESGTAAAAAAAAYAAAAPAGLDPGYLVLALAFGLAWERLASATVLLQRRANGRLLIRTAAMAARKLEQRHLAAMTLDLLRGSSVTVAGGLIGYLLLAAVGPVWGLDPALTAAVLMVVAAGMVGTAIPLFGGVTRRPVAVVAGVVAGVLATLVLR
jgi:mannose/fructose/N-acetylgalactosamine-specific phosphotransferase system component IIC